MLVLTRKLNESIIIGDNIKITIADIQNQKVRIGIEAPKDVQIMREELVNGTAKAPPKPRRFRILIVEDDQVDRVMIRRYLAASGQHEISFLETSLGREGLESCKNERPDFVVLDYRLPDIDGLAFLEKLRHDQAGQAIPVLFVSGSMNEQTKTEAMRQGAQGYLAKQDLSPESLRAAIFEAMRSFSEN